MDRRRCTPMRLGQRLLAEKLIDEEQLKEALEGQVVHGGRLGTNLVELGMLEEAELARVLGQMHGCPFASGEMHPDPQALATVDIHFMDKHDVVPMRVDATRLSVAVINPRDFQPLDALAFKTGRRVVAVVIPEYRMNQLLRRHAKAFRTLRALDMNMLRPSRREQEKAAEAAARAELVSEEDFQKLYAQALQGLDMSLEEEPVLEGEVVAEEPPAVVAPAAVARPPVVQSKAAPAAGAPPPVEPPLPAPVPLPTPLTFAAAQAQLAQSSDREDVARTILRFAVSKWRRALLLSVQGQLLTGWHGLGQGIREEAVRRIGVVLRGQSTFKLVRDLRSHYVGPMRRDAGTTVFYKLLGGGFPTTAVLLPLLVRGKVVHLLYVDNGPDQLTPPDVGELLILSQGVARSYEAMIRRRQSA
jgi:hypothetical protein